MTNQKSHKNVFIANNSFYINIVINLNLFDSGKYEVMLVIIAS